jgi:predicted RND superfamily exporter protein
MNIWAKLAGIILRNKLFFLLFIAGTTVFFVSQWKYVRISYTQKSILPDDDPYAKEYAQFRKIFNNDNNLILIGIKDSTLFTKEKLNLWNRLANDFSQFDEVEQVFSIANLKILKKDTVHQKFILQDFLQNPLKSDAEALSVKNKLFDSLPFYQGFIYNKETGAVQTIVALKKEIAKSKKRIGFIINKVKPLLDTYKNKYGLDIKTSGLIYIKALNAKVLEKEIPLFIILSLLATGLLILFLFRSGSPIIISLLIVSIGVMWSFGIMGFLRYQISILTAIIPPLVIVIGVPNAIFLINKYQQEIQSHGNQAKSLQRVITKTGNAILMTNVTTAIGFGTFIIVKNDLLREFGIVAALSILSIFVLSILLIPIIYSYRKIPKDEHLEHLNKEYITKFMNWLVKMVRHRQKTIFGVSLILIIVSIIGAYKIKVSGSMLSDLPKNTNFYNDIKFFEHEFGGILPLEFMIDTKRKKGAYKLATLKRMDKFQEEIQDLPELSKPVSLVDLTKFTKQAFYNGNPEYYQLPSSHEKNFIMTYLKNSKGNGSLLHSYTDSLQRYLRITTFMKDIETKKMEQIENYLSMKQKKYFPPKKYNVLMTGQAKLYLKGTHYLIDNLAISLGLAIFLIFIFIAWMFGGSLKMAIISLIPNLLPLLITAGIMGFAGIPLKPSTILIFSIAFGISVDDTIHYLAKLRQELRHHKGQVKRSVYKALKETGISMFYTSIVLFFGFLVFMKSGYGGTVALGGLISLTLLMAMFSNLLLLPALVLFMDDLFKNKKPSKSNLIIYPEDEKIDFDE